MSAGRGDAHGADLGAGEHVVEVITEPVHPPHGERTRQRRPAALDEAQRRGVVAVDHLVGKLEDALEHHRHASHGGHRLGIDDREGRLGIEASLAHQPVAELGGHLVAAVAERVEHRGGHKVDVTDPPRDDPEDGGGGDQARRGRALRSFGGARRARGQDDLTTGSSRRIGFGPGEAARPGRRSSGEGCDDPSDQATMHVACRDVLVDHVDELGVGDDRRCPFPRDDLGDLWSGEPGVEVDRVGPGLRDRHRCDDEPPMVPAEQSDRVVAGDPAVDQGSSQRVRQTVDLGEAEHAVVVDDRGLERDPIGCRGIPGRRRGSPSAGVLRRRSRHAGLEQPDTCERADSLGAFGQFVTGRGHGGSSAPRSADRAPGERGGIVSGGEGTEVPAPSVGPGSDPVGGQRVGSAGPGADTTVCVVDVDLDLGSRLQLCGGVGHIEIGCEVMQSRELEARAYRPRR